MNYGMNSMIKIEYSDTFLKEAKKLAKKFKNLKKDLQEAVDEINTRNDLGVFLGSGIYKKRVKNSSIPTGKSGGFRIILLLQQEDRVVLLSIYSKTEMKTLSDEELRELVRLYLAKSS